MATMNFKESDRLPFCEFLGFWPSTCNRWYREGLPIDLTVNDYFGFDNIRRLEIDLDFGPIPRFVKRTLSEDEEAEIIIDEMGIKKKVKKRGYSSSKGPGLTIPQFLEFPVKNMEDFEAMKKRFDPYNSLRYPPDWSEEFIEYCETVDVPVRIKIPGFFGKARDFMGLENLLKAFYTDPELVHEIMSFWSWFTIETLRKAVENCRVDYATFWEDMAYKHGPHISPRLFREFMLPHYKKVTNFLKKNGVNIIMVDSDGNINALVPLWLEGGVNCLYPLEVAAGVDAPSLRKTYGRRLRLIGNVDKRALIKGKAAIKKEVESKIPYLKETGGYIPSVDHLVPVDVPFENYRYYIQLLKELL